VEKNPASLLVVSLGNALNGMSLPLEMAAAHSTVDRATGK